ncbi:MAG: hypothetical protein WEC79_03290 [Thermomicrobiales bacterium]
MRLVWLFLRSRLAGPALAGIALTALLAVAWERWFGHEPEAMTAAMILFPLVVACVIGTGAHSAFGETELTASLSLPLLRGVYLAGLIAVGALALLLAALAWTLPDDGGTLARNLAGLSGLALLAAPVVGGRLSWIVPVTLAMAAQLLAISDLPSWLALTWPQASFDNDRALALALGLLGSGLAAVHVFGPKVARDEAAG